MVEFESLLCGMAWAIVPSTVRESQRLIHRLPAGEWGIFPLIHMGRPWLAYWIAPYPNTRGSLWVNFRSPLVWDFFAISTYFLVSLIFWSLALVVVLKYLVFVMRADNHGEGGIMALIALISPAVRLRSPLSPVIPLARYVVPWYEGGEDREQSFIYLQANFLPGGTIETAYGSDKSQ